MLAPITSVQSFWSGKLSYPLGYLLNRKVQYNYMLLCTHISELFSNIGELIFTILK